MSDLIDRQAALFLADGGCHPANIAKEIRKLPSAQSERKKGEWIPEFNGNFTGGAYWFSCSKCKRIVPEVRNGGWNFCPNCGAEMEVDDADG